MQPTDRDAPQASRRRVPSGRFKLVKWLVLGALGLGVWAGLLVLGARLLLVEADPEAESAAQREAAASTTTTLAARLNVPPSFDTAAYGFALIDSKASLRPTYTIQVRSGSRQDQVLQAAVELADSFNAEMTTTKLTVDPVVREIPLKDTTEVGVIEIRVDPSPPEGCDDHGVAGCAEPPWYDLDGVVQGGVVWVSSRVWSQLDPGLQRDLLMHEVLHVLNLAHMDETYLGAEQVMSSMLSADAVGLGAGDTNGLRYLGNFAGGPIPPEALPAQPFVRRCEDTRTCQ